MDAIAEKSGVYNTTDALEWEDKVIRVLVATNGGLVSGPPGCGKSHLIKKLQAHLTALDEKNVTCAYTSGSSLGRWKHSCSPAPL